MRTRQVLVGAGLLLAAWTMQPRGASAIDQAGCPAMASDGESLACQEGAARPLEGIRYADASLPVVARKCRAILSELFGIDAGAITPGSRFVDDLGLDELDMAEVVMAMEDRFNIEVPDEVAKQMLRFGDMVAIAAGEFALVADDSAAVAPPESEAVSSTRPSLPARALPDEAASILLFGGDFCPKGTVAAAGQSLTFNDNQVLLSLLGLTYGGSQSKQTFELPDLRGKEPVPGTRYCLVVDGIYPSRP